MKNKILISTLLFLILAIAVSTHTLATNNMMNSAKNGLKNVGSSITNAGITAKDTIVNGTQDLINGAENFGNDMMGDTQNDTTALGTMGTDDYTAQRTAATDTGLFGMSVTASTWLILAVVGAIIVGLVWYYGAQYEHKNYSND